MLKKGLRNESWKEKGKPPTILGGDARLQKIVGTGPAEGPSSVPAREFTEGRSRMSAVKEGRVPAGTSGEEGNLKQTAVEKGGETPRFRLWKRRFPGPENPPKNTPQPKKQNPPHPNKTPPHGKGSVILKKGGRSENQHGYVSERPLWSKSNTSRE